MKASLPLSKTRRGSATTLLFGTMLSLLIVVPPAQAGYIVTLQQVGPNVVATGSGAVDLTGLMTVGVPQGTASGIGGILEFIVTGPATGFSLSYSGTITGPTSFGTGIGTNASSGSGDFAGIAFGDLVVPVGYVSGSALSDSSTYDKASFSSLGLTPGGTYEWTWGSGPNQNVTLQIGTAGVPDSGSTLALFFVALSGLLGLSRFKSFLSA